VSNLKWLHNIYNVSCETMNRNLDRWIPNGKIEPTLESRSEFLNIANLILKKNINKKAQPVKT